MQSFDIDANKQFVLSRERRTRKVTLKQSATLLDYPEGLLLAIDGGKFVPVEDETENALCALLKKVPKEALNAGDVVADVVYYVGVGKDKIMFANEHIRITEKFIEATRKNKLDIMNDMGKFSVKVAELIVEGDLTNTAYTEDTVDITGLTFSVKYTDGASKSVDSDEVTVSPATWGEEAGKQELTISYTEDGYTVSATIEVEVELDVPSSLAVSGDWTNTQTHETAVDPTGLTFTATYLSGKEADVTAKVTVSPETWGETVGEQTATFSYTEGEVTVTATKTANVE